MKILDLQGAPVLSTGPAVLYGAPRLFFSALPNVGTTITLASGTAYFVYVGRPMQAIIPQFVNFNVSTAGAGGQTAEVGLFSTPKPPSKGTGQTVTKLFATNIVNSLTTVGFSRNTNAFTYIVPAGTNLWAGLRTAMATTQPTMPGLCMDYNEGLILMAAGAGPLNAGTSWSAVTINPGALISAALAPDLRISLD